MSICCVGWSCNRTKRDIDYSFPYAEVLGMSYIASRWHSQVCLLDISLTLESRIFTQYLGDAILVWRNLFDLLNYSSSSRSSFKLKRDDLTTFKSSAYPFIVSMISHLSHWHFNISASTWCILIIHYDLRMPFCCHRNFSAIFQHFINWKINFHTYHHKICYMG